MTPRPVSRPHAIARTLPVVRQFTGKNGESLAARIAPALQQFLLQLFAPESITNVAGAEKDSGDFRFALRNPWVSQDLTALELTIDGRAVPREKLFFPDAASGAIPFCRNAATTVIVKGRALGDGLHFLGLTLIGTALTLRVAQTPIQMTNGVGQLAFSPPQQPGHNGAVIPCLIDDLPWTVLDEQRRHLAIGHLLEVVRRLENHPATTYTFGGSLPLAALAARHPRALESLRELVAAKRCEAVAGFVTEPGFAWLGGESIIRQIVRRQDEVTQTLGAPSGVAWVPSAAALPASLPQILKKAGVHALAVGVAAPDNLPAQFMWEGVDGTRLKSARLQVVPGAYPPAREGSFSANDTTRPLSVAPVVYGNPLPTDADTLPSAFFAAMPSRGRPVIKGDLMAGPLAAIAARPLLRDLHKRAETAVLDLERLPVIVGLDVDAGYRDTLAEAWNVLLATQHHSILAGAVTDAVAAEATYRLRSVIDLCAGARQPILQRLAATITPPPGAEATGAMVLVNTLPFWREKIVAIDQIAVDGRVPLLHDGKHRLAVQVVHAESYEDGDLKRTRALFRVAMPPAGYRVLWETSPTVQVPAAPPRAAVSAVANRLENGWLTITFNRKDGTIAQIVDRHRNRTYRIEEAGLLLHSDQRLNCDGPSGDHKSLRSFQVRDVDLLETGPLRAAIRYSGKLGGYAAQITYRLGQTGKSIEATITLAGKPEQGTLAVRIPRLREAARIVHEVPYGQVVRDTGVFPALSYLDVAPHDHGLAILNAGGGVFKVTPKHVWLHMATSMDRVHWLDEDGTPLPAQLTFRYALFPHENNASTARVFRRGLDFNTPLLTHHETSLAIKEDADAPRVSSLFTLEPDAIEVGAVWRAEDGSVFMRLIERVGKDTFAELKVKLPFARLEITDLRGQAVSEHKIGRWFKKKDVIDLRFRAFEIKTLRLRLTP